jgi:predicted helicase
MDVRTFSDREGVPYLFPLYIYESGPEERQGKLMPIGVRRPNFSPTFLNLLAEKLDLPQEEPYGLPKGITPEEILYYAYAVFHSPRYRTRYAEFLKIDFPHLPLTSDAELFRALAEKGSELVALHLMDSPKLDNFITEFPEKGDNLVEKVRYISHERRAWINKTQYFGGVPEEVWQFQIGGYQVCDRWLKDRQGRKIIYDDIQHYQRIVVALNETIQLMGEIEKTIASHGGWPSAFAT